MRTWTVQVVAMYTFPMLYIINADHFALVDDQCEIINLSDYATSLDNGKPLFASRGTYYLLAVECNGMTLHFSIRTHGYNDML